MARQRELLPERKAFINNLLIVPKCRHIKHQYKLIIILILYHCSKRFLQNKLHAPLVKKENCLRLFILIQLPFYIITMWNFPIW